MIQKLQKVDYIVFHCSATPEGQNVTASIIDGWHKDRGFDKIGYHVVIQLDGTIEFGRALDEVGAHVKGHNHNSIAVVYAGGLDELLHPKDTRTPEQKEAMRRVAIALQNLFPEARLVGHRDLSPDLNGDGIITSNEWLKDCPCFSVAEWAEEVNL